MTLSHFLHHRSASQCEALPKRRLTDTGREPRGMFLENKSRNDVGNYLWITRSVQQVGDAAKYRGSGRDKRSLWSCAWITWFMSHTARNKCEGHKSQYFIPKKVETRKRKNRNHLITFLHLSPINSIKMCGQTEQTNELISATSTVPSLPPLLLLVSLSEVNELCL